MLPGCCVRGNKHAVGLQMVSDAFLLAGWNVHLLGPDVPIDVLLEHVQQWSPDIVGLSASLPQHVVELQSVTQKLCNTLGDACPPLLVGGQGFHAGAMTSAGGGRAIVMPDPESAVLFAEQHLRVKAHGAITPDSPASGVTQLPPKRRTALGAAAKKHRELH